MAASSSLLQGDLAIDELSEAAPLHQDVAAVGHLAGIFHSN